jgi:uncharacterized protein YbaA (DUF1428 family)
MTYIDGFVFLVKKKNIKAYEKMARAAGKIWEKHGALKYVECIGDDVSPKMVELTFPKLTKMKKDETVWFSFVVYENKSHRDRVNKKIMNDPAMDIWKDKPMPFDMKKMAYGGFRAVVDI